MNAHRRHLDTHPLRSCASTSSSGTCPRRRRRGNQHAAATRASRYPARAAEKHRIDPACTSFHEMMDPIGFAFENYDALGTWRTTDNGLPVDATTEVEGTELEGGVELGELVAQLPEVGACVARRFYQHATAHLDDPSEKKAVEKLVADFVSSDYDFQQLVVALVTNDGFRYAAPQGEE